MVPVKSAGFGGAVNVGNPEDILMAPGVNPFEAQAPSRTCKRPGRKQRHPIRRSKADSATAPARPDSRTNRGRWHSRREPRCSAAERFPGRSQARLQRGPIHLNAGARTRILTRDQELSIGGIKVRHAIAHFALGRHHRPRQTEIQGQILADAPIVLDEWTVQFPAAAGISATKLLVVDRQAGQTCQKVRCRIAGPTTGDHPESVRETDGHRVQLIRANRCRRSGCRGCREPCRTNRRTSKHSSRPRTAYSRDRPATSSHSSTHRRQTAAIASQDWRRECRAPPPDNCRFPAR